jgi:hypothetical protein
MSVNLSTVQLKRPTLVSDIDAVLRECQVNPQAVVLELTEGVACENPAAVKTALMQLRALGIRISIDDFGTGYSSLSYLRQLPVDTLKVDRSFVLGMRTDDESAAIIGTVTRMATQLGLHVVAEGIEREEQVGLLRSLHCESGQGYLFARPLDAEVATEILKTGVPLPRAVETDTGLVVPEPIAAAKMAGRSLRLRKRWGAVAVAAGVVLAMAGVANRFTREAPASERAAGSVRVEHSVPASPTAAITQMPPNGQTKSPPMAKAVNRDSTRPRTAPVAANTAPPPPEVKEAINKSWQVQHLHRLGSCVGRLAVSRTGLVFTPDDKSSKDAFSLAHHEFLPSSADRTLTIKSNTKAYRFRALADGRSSDEQTRFQELTEAITKVR